MCPNSIASEARLNALAVPRPLRGFFGGGACFAVVFLLVVAASMQPARAYAATESFAFLADTHLGQPYQPAYDDAKKALLLVGEFDSLKAVCVAGDLTDRGSAKAYSEWEYLCASLMPDVARIQAMGDHDTGKNGAYLRADSSLTVSGGLKRFKDINGGALTSYTEFEHANIMTVGGVRARGHSVITNGMLKQLNNRLQKTVRQGKVAVVVCHYPYSGSELNMRAKLLGILRSYPNVIYVSGHRHRYSARAQCQVVSPAASTTPYARAGVAKSAKYPFRSVGVNACCRYRSGGDSYADTLAIDDAGRMVLRRWNATKGRVEKTWKFTQVKSSVKIKAVASAAKYPKSAKMVYRVTFSDGKTHGGLKNGALLSLAVGKSTTIKQIPAGVLVTVKAVKAPAGWTKAKAQQVEAGTSMRTAKMKSSYKAKTAKKSTAAKASKLRVASV